MPLFKSTGTTPSEQYLARLCQQTFLTLWSYPNVFRDQGQHRGKGDGKELCDLLVVCGNDVVIFSDKSCQFPETGDLKVDWCRWFRRSVLTSAEQVYGAERWIRQHPDRLFLDRKCTQPFPLPVADPATLRFHRVVIALNVAGRCRRAMGGSGGLMVSPDVVGQAHVDPTASGFQPFFVGQIDPSRGFVHVFDDVGLDVVMRELDTVKDFLRYLSHKEKSVDSGYLGIASDETDLVAAYLMHTDSAGNHCFPPVPVGSRVALTEGFWDALLSNPKYLAKKKADQISYVWDGIIEEFIQNTLNETLVGGSPTTVAENEPVLRVIAMESRVSRRHLSKALVGLVRQTPREIIGRRTILSDNCRDTLYVFVAMSNDGMEQGEFREFRRAYLGGYCHVVAWKNRQYKRVVGLATETGAEKERFHDLLCFEPGDWTKEMEDDARRIQQETGFFTNVARQNVREREYPDLPQTDSESSGATAKKPGRNDLCPCGSGRKFKKCCMPR